MSNHGGPGRARTIAEIVAGAGVVASLIFVGLELRQNTASVRAQTRQGLAEQNMDFLALLGGSPEIARAWDVRWEPFGPRPNELLTLADSAQARTTLIGLIRLLENVYLQALEGVVDESVLDTYGFQETPVFRSPKFVEFWPIVRGRFDSRFVAAFEAEYELPRL